MGGFAALTPSVLRCAVLCCAVLCCAVRCGVLRCVELDVPPRAEVQSFLSADRLRALSTTLVTHYFRLSCQHLTEWSQSAEQFYLDATRDAAACNEEDGAGGGAAGGGGGGGGARAAASALFYFLLRDQRFKPVVVPHLFAMLTQCMKEFPAPAPTAAAGGSGGSGGGGASYSPVSSAQFHAQLLTDAVLLPLVNAGAALIEPLTKQFSAFYTDYLGRWLVGASAAEPGLKVMRRRVLMLIG